MSPTPFEPASGAIWTVLGTPSAAPVELRNALPESPGIPGDTVYTLWLQPPPSSPRLTPCFGLSWLTPPRSSEFPYEYTFSPWTVPLVSMPFGPPQNGIDGLTFPKSAGFNLINARSLNWQVLASASPSPCIVSRELWTMTPGWDAPV